MSATATFTATKILYLQIQGGKSRKPGNSEKKMNKCRPTCIHVRSFVLQTYFASPPTIFLFGAQSLRTTIRTNDKNDVPYVPRIWHRCLFLRPDKRPSADKPPQPWCLPTTVCQAGGQGASVECGTRTTASRPREHIRGVRPMDGKVGLIFVFFYLCYAHALPVPILHPSVSRGTARGGAPAAARLSKLATGTPREYGHGSTAVGSWARAGARRHAVAGGRGRAERGRQRLRPTSTAARAQVRVL